MYCHDRFDPAICGLDKYNQAVEIKRLAEFADQVSVPEVWEYINNNLICVDRAAWDHIHIKFTKFVIGSTLLKLIEADLLRYGTLVGQGDLKQGFGAVQRSVAALGYIQRRVLPLDYITGCLLILLAHGCVLVEIKERRGEPDFMFSRVWDRTATAKQLIEELPSEGGLEAIARK